MRDLTLLATVPLMDAIMAMLPPFPCRIISLATACAVMNAPVIFTYCRQSNTQLPLALPLTSNIRLASFCEYSNAGVSC